MIFVLLVSCCGGSEPRNANTIEAASPTPAGPSPSPLSNFEERLQYVRNGQYTYIWVFSRKDGKPLEPADSIFLRANAPQVVDWVTTDDMKKAIAGTNFNLEEGNLELLKKRYVAEDYSNK
ncbi:MAG TPA: hypothetical protein VKB02_14400 [Pyrinomonadaceae bacterium]|nr:hypothetical protein [Pyrinomonadaceae bacterium]